MRRFLIAAVLAMSSSAVFAFTATNNCRVGWASHYCVPGDNAGPVAAPWDGTVWNNPSSGYPVGTSHQSYYSNLMQTQVGYTTYLPPNYASTSTRYPVVYMLHGQPGPGGENVIPLLNNTVAVTQLDSMIRSNAVKPMIVVFVNGGSNSHYMDASPGASAYPSYLMQATMLEELIPAVDAAFRTIQSNVGRALQGMSMGGQGCEVIGFGHPDLFGSLYCFAPAIDDVVAGFPTCTPPNGCNDVTQTEPQLLADMFGNDTAVFMAHTAWGLAVSNAAKIKARAMPIHVSIGNQDSLLTANQDMDGLLTAQGITHDALQVVSGCGHDFNCLLAGVNYANYTYAAAHFP